MPDRLPPGPPSPEQFARYLAAESSPTERAAVRRQLDEHPELARALDRYLRALDGEDTRPQPPDAAASFASLAARLREEERAEPAARHARPARIQPPVRTTRSWRVVLGVGGVLAAGLVGAVLFAGRHERPLAAARTYVTADGERADVQLKDGTLIHMAPGSRLVVAAGFGEPRRDVHLDGEAYFAVVHDAKHPFTVRTGNVSVRDLGTAFAVRAFAEDSAVQVVVRNGEVAMSRVGRLGAGDMGRLGSDGRGSIVHGADVDALLGWVHGRLQFTDAPLGRVLADVRRWYGVDAELADSTLAGLPFTGTLSDLAPSDAVGLVGATLGMRVQPDGDRLVLHSIPGRTPRPRAASPTP